MICGCFAWFAFAVFGICIVLGSWEGVWVRWLRLVFRGLVAVFEFACTVWGSVGRVLSGLVG